MNDFEDDVNDYSYKNWERQRDKERAEKSKWAEQYASIDKFVEEYFANNWKGIEPKKLYNNKTGRFHWVWTETPRLDRKALPQRVKSGSKVPNTLRALVEGRDDS